MDITDVTGYGYYGRSGQAVRKGACVGLRLANRERVMLEALQVAAVLTAIVAAVMSYLLNKTDRHARPSHRERRHAHRHAHSA